MNPLDTMHVFVRVAELASFTRAAESLGLPKASVSAALQQLEGQLGARLLHRTTRKVEMTQDGHAYYERCKDVLADMDELQSMFRQAPQALRGRLRVDMPSGVARSFILPRLPGFLAEHPLVELELSSTDRRVDVVREGFDCVLRIGALADSSLIARPLGSFRLINCASPAYLAAHGLPQSLEDLSGHKLIHYVPVLGSRSAGWEYLEGGSTRYVAMSGALTVNNAEAYEAACLAGLGIIQAPAVSMQPLIAQGLLVEVMPQYRPPPMPVSLLYAHRRNLSARVKVFMAWMEQTLAPRLDPLN